MNNTYEYFRLVYPRIKEEDIESFSKTYKNSDMEKEDLIQFYLNNKGDVTLILECIPLSDNNDAERFISFYEDMIKEKKIKKYKAFDKTKKKIKLLDDEWEEAEEEEKNMKELEQQIILRNKKKRGNYEDFLGSLADKYCSKEEKYEDDMNDEEFEKERQKISFKKKKYH